MNVTRLGRGCHREGPDFPVASVLTKLAGERLVERVAKACEGPNWPAIIPVQGQEASSFARGCAGHLSLLHHCGCHAQLAQVVCCRAANDARPSNDHPFLGSPIAGCSSLCGQPCHLVFFMKHVATEWMVAI